MAGRRAVGPPPSLAEDADASAVWREVVAAHPDPARIVGPQLEAYCVQVAALRDARRRIASEGLLVAGPKGEAIPHPALAIATSAQDQVRRWGDRFAPGHAAKRRSGPVYDETASSVTHAPHLADKRYAGPVAVLKTLAWLIDEAQRDGIEALQKAAFGSIPTYLKACAELQITPASVPTSTGGTDSKGGGATVSDLRAAAARRRGEAV